MYGNQIDCNYTQWTLKYLERRVMSDIRELLFMKHILMSWKYWKSGDSLKQEIN